MSKRSPRLQFTEEERASPELQKVITKADKAADKLEKAEARIPKKTVKVKERVLDEKTGKITTTLSFEELDKKPPSKLTHAATAVPINSVSVAAHREIHQSEDDNVGVESAHKLIPYDYDVEVPYTYYICTVKLENFNLSHVPVYIMSQEQLSMYAAYMGTLGNRPDLFNDSGYVDRYYNTEYEDYEIPPEALEDEQFAAMIAEAEKYLAPARLSER